MRTSSHYLDSPMSQCPRLRLAMLGRLTALAPSPFCLELPIAHMQPEGPHAPLLDPGFRVPHLPGQRPCNSRDFVVAWPGPVPLNSNSLLVPYPLALKGRLAAFVPKPRHGATAPERTDAATQGL